ANFHGQKRKNDTHASTTDPDCRLYRKAAGREAKLCYMGHATMENRHGLAVAGMVTLATGTAERRASEPMLKAKVKKLGRRITVGEDKAYDTADHVTNLRAINVTPPRGRSWTVERRQEMRASRGRRPSRARLLALWRPANSVSRICRVCDDRGACFKHRFKAHWPIGSNCLTQQVVGRNTF